jgi:hypothetical protein
MNQGTLIQRTPQLQDKVVEALQSLNRPASIVEIIREMENLGFEFTLKTPRQEVYIRINKFSSVAKVGDGLYTLNS